MAGYKESLITLNNLSASVRQHLKVEAGLVSEKEYKEIQKANEDLTQRINRYHRELWNKEHPHIPFRRVPEVNKDILDIDEQINVAQTKIDGLAKLEGTIQSLTKRLDNEKSLLAEYRNNDSNKENLALEADLKQERAEKSQAVNAAENKLAEVSKNPNNEAELKQATEELAQLNKDIKSLETKLTQVFLKLAPLKSLSDKVEATERALDKAKEQYSQDSVSQSPTIAELKTRKDQLVLESQGKLFEGGVNLDDVNKSLRPNRSYYNGTEDYSGVLDSNYDDDDDDDDEGDEKEKQLIDWNNSFKRYKGVSEATGNIFAETRNKLGTIENELREALTNWSNSPNSPNDTEQSQAKQSIQKSLMEIDECTAENKKLIEERKQSHLFSRDELKEIQATIDKNLLTIMTEEKNIDALTKSIPELKALIDNRKKTKKEMDLVSSVAIKENRVLGELDWAAHDIDQLQNSIGTFSFSSPREIRRLIKKEFEKAEIRVKNFYKENKTYFINLIADEVISNLLDTLTDEKSMFEIISEFVYKPGDEQSNLDSKINSAEDMKNVEGLIKVDVKKVQEMVNKYYRTDVFLHTEIVTKFSLALNKIRNDASHEINDIAIDVFARHFFNFGKGAYLANKEPPNTFKKTDTINNRGYASAQNELINNGDINSAANEIIAFVTTRLVRKFNQILSETRSGLQEAATELSKELKKFKTPEAAEQMRIFLTQKAQANILEATAKIESSTLFTPEEKQDKIKQITVRFERVMNAEINKIDVQDADRIDALQITVSELQYRQGVVDTKEEIPKAISKALQAPGSRELQPAISQMFEYMAAHPGIDQVQNTTEFIKMLDSSKSIFKFVYDNLATNGAVWTYVMSWSPAPMKNDVHNFPFLSYVERQIPIKTQFSDKVTYKTQNVYGYVAVLFKMQLDKTDYHKGTLTITLGNKDYQSWGKVTIGVQMDNAGKITSEIKELTPISKLDEGGKIVPNPTSAQMEIEGYRTLNNTIRGLLEPQRSLISKKDFMLDQSNRAEVINLATQEMYKIAVIKIKEETSEAITSKQKSALLNQISAKLNLIYDEMIIDNIRTARVIALKGIRNFAQLSCNK